MNTNSVLRSELLSLLASEVSQPAKILSLAAIFAPAEPKITPSFAAKFGLSASTLSRHKNELDMEKIANLREQFVSLESRNDAGNLDTHDDDSFDPTEMNIPDDTFSAFINLNAQRRASKRNAQDDSINSNSLPDNSSVSPNLTFLPETSKNTSSARDFFAFFLPTLTEDIKTRMRNHTFTFSMPLAVSSFRFTQRGRVVEKFEKLVASLEGKSKEEIEEEIVKEENTKILEDYIVCLPENQEWVEKLSKVN